MNEKSSTCLSEGDYLRLAQEVRNRWSATSKHNRLYLLALVMSFVIQKLGQVSGHHLFGNPFVIAVIYLIAFAFCLTQLVKRRLIDEQLINSINKGINLEKEHSYRGVDYFHQFVSNYRLAGFSVISLAFFRVVIPSWLIFSAFDFLILAQLFPQLSKWSASLGSAAVFVSASMFLWKIGCQPYRILEQKG